MKLFETIQVLKRLDTGDLKNELDNLTAVYEWSQKQAVGKTKVGDIVPISEHLHISSSSGWYPYRECLVPGQLVEIKDIKFSTYHNRWMVNIMPLEEWTISSSEEERFQKSYWHGP